MPRCAWGSERPRAYWNGGAGPKRFLKQYDEIVNRFTACELAASKSVHDPDDVPAADVNVPAQDGKLVDRVVRNGIVAPWLGVQGRPHGGTRLGHGKTTSTINQLVPRH